MDRLRDVRLKLDRADRHFQELKAEIIAFIKTNSRRIRGEYEVDSGEYVFPRQGLSHIDPDLTWSPIIGDVVHNLHAVLDYLVCQLYLANNAGPCTTQIQFPIFSCESSYWKNVSRRTERLDALAVAAIENLQPFKGQTVSARANHPLMLLYALEQRDKHRMLHTSATSMTLSPPPNYAMEFVSLVMTPESNTEFARAKFKGGRSDMDVYLEPIRDIVFDPKGPAAEQSVIKLLESIKTHITRTVIPALEPFLR